MKRFKEGPINQSFTIKLVTRRKNPVNKLPICNKAIVIFPTKNWEERKEVENKS